MNRRATLALLLVAVLLATFLALTRSGTVSLGEEETEADEEIGSDVIDLFEEAASDPVVAFRITDSTNGLSLTAESEDFVWTITESPVEPGEGEVVQSERLDAAARAISTMVSTRQFSPLENLGQYGLESARYRLEFTTEGGSQHTLDIGEATLQANQYYTQRDGDALVHLVSTASLDTFILFLSDPPYAVPTPVPEATPTLELGFTPTG